MNVERLNLMVTMLQEVVDGIWKPTNLIAVEFSSWEDDEDKNRRAFELEHWVKKSSKPCGYSACAVGHALLDKRFAGQGLTPSNDGCEIYPKYEGETYLDGVASFFGVEEDIAHNLFIPGEYSEHLKDKALATQVMRRIKKLLEVGEDKYRTILVECDFDTVSCWHSSDRLISPQGRVYNYQYKGKE